MLSVRQSSRFLRSPLCLSLLCQWVNRIPFNSGQIVLESVGQANNSGANSVQFGYASKVAGIGNAVLTNTAADQNESTARFTFIPKS